MAKIFVDGARENCPGFCYTKKTLNFLSIPRVEE